MSRLYAALAVRYDVTGAETSRAIIQDALTTKAKGLLDFKTQLTDNPDERVVIETDKPVTVVPTAERLARASLLAMRDRTHFCARTLGKMQDSDVRVRAYTRLSDSPGSGARDRCRRRPTTRRIRRRYRRNNLARAIRPRQWPEENSRDCCRLDRIDAR